MKFEITPDNQFLKVTEATSHELEQLKISFTKKIDGHKFHPLVRKNIWDGNVEFIKHSIFVPIGLWNEVLKMGKSHNIHVEIYGLERIKNYINREEFDQFFLDFFKDREIQPREYQLTAVYNILVWGKTCSEIATSAGKTLICFLCFLWMKEKMGIKRTLMIVPKTQLATQGISDFAEYTDIKKFQYYSKSIIEGSKEELGAANFVIGTYQTLVKRKIDFFSQFDAVIIDESHSTKAESIKSILNMCINTRIRFGLSGTLLKTGTCEDFTIQSYLGPRIQKISPDFLISNGYATPIHVKSIWLDYLSFEQKENLARMRVNQDLSGSDMYNLERRVIIEDQKRFDFVVNMISKVTKNSLVLFSNIKDDYGRRIYDAIRNSNTGIEAFYVDGGTSTDHRTFYQKKMEEGNNKVMVASFATTSTGISIKNIHTIFFVESYKSEVIVKQSIGRGMRLFEGKEYVTIIDFVDDFSVPDVLTGRVNNKSRGIIAKHGLERLKIYENEGFPTKIINVKI